MARRASSNERSVSAPLRSARPLRSTEKRATYGLVEAGGKGKASGHLRSKQKFAIELAAVTSAVVSKLVNGTVRFSDGTLTLGNGSVDPMVCG